MKAGEALPFSESINAVGRPITYYPIIAKALGSVKTGIFVSNFLFWDGKQKDNEGWIFKKQVEITDETGLSRTEQENARKRLVQLEILEQKKKGIPPKLYYRFNWKTLDNVIMNYINEGIKPKNKVSTTENPILFDMKEIFDSKYIVESEGVEFEWGKGQAAGKHWKGLKNLKEYFESRIKNSLQDTNEEKEVDKETILKNWTVFLEMIPRYHLERHLTPMLLYSNINEIINSIKTEQKNVTRNKEKTRDTSGTTASQYVE